MTNDLKQVYASLFIDENELQILVGEYFNTRFNIIRIERVKMEGIVGYKINDSEKVVDIISKTVKYVSEKIGASLKKVILVLPPANFKRYPLRVSVVPNGGIVTKTDIAKALTSSLNSKVDGNLIVINSSIIKYIVNGIATRRMPEKEICDELIVDIDLLCADKDMTLDYVKAVSDAGLDVLDITLNTYAIAKEAVLIEQSLNQNIVLLDIGNKQTYLTLLSKGKLVSTEIISDGLDCMINAIHDEFNIDFESIPRLLKYNVDFDSDHPNDAVFAWGSDKENFSVTIKDLSLSVEEPLNNYLDKILTMCKPIIEFGETCFFVTGEGAKMNSLISKLQELTNCNVRSYYPDTIGIRDSSLCALFGAFFVYREKCLLNDLNVSCLDIAEYDETVDMKKVDVEGESLTSKIKKLFETYKEKGDE